MKTWFRRRGVVITALLATAIAVLAAGHNYLFPDGLSTIRDSHVADLLAPDSSVTFAREQPGRRLGIDGGVESSIEHDARTSLSRAAVLNFYHLKLEALGWSYFGSSVMMPDDVVVSFSWTKGPLLARVAFTNGSPTEYHYYINKAG